MRSRKIIYLNLLKEWKKKGLITDGGIIVGAEKLPKYIYNSGSLKCFSYLYNLLNVEIGNDIIYSKKYGKINFIRSPFNSGLLTKRFNDNLKFPKSDFRYEYFSGKNYKLKLKKIIHLKKKFKFKDIHTGNFALKFIFSNKNIDSCFFGASKKSQISHLLNLNLQNLFNNQKFKDIEKEVRHINKINKTNDQY